MKTIGIIPARGGSKGIPKKNIKLLNGKPLIAYTIDAALKSCIERVIVSTDCHEIREISLKFGAEVIQRPMTLAEDDTPTLPVLQHVMKSVKENYEAIVTLQPTSPMRTNTHINEAILLFENNIEADCLVSVCEVPHNFMPEKLMELAGKYLIGNLEVKQRQQVKTKMARNGAAIYITRTNKIHEYILGGKILPFKMDMISSVDIDNMQDWQLAECLLKNKI